MKALGLGFWWMLWSDFAIAALLIPDTFAPAWHGDFCMIYVMI
jgi:hypothetical protein